MSIIARYVVKTFLSTLFDLLNSKHFITNIFLRNCIDVSSIIHPPVTFTGSVGYFFYSNCLIPVFVFKTTAKSTNKPKRHAYLGRVHPQTSKSTCVFTYKIRHIQMYLFQQERVNMIIHCLNR